jgi:hypothetical protein
MRCKESEGTHDSAPEYQPNAAPPEDLKKRFHCERSGALVAIDKGLRFRNEVAVRGGLFMHRRVRIFAKSALLWLRDRRGQLVRRSNAGQTTELGQRGIMQRDDLIECQIEHRISAHRAPLFRKPLHQATAFPHDLATDSDDSGVVGVPVRANHDSVVFDADLDLRVRRKVNLL